jgi:cytochrome b
MSEGPPSLAPVRVWDVPTRLVHWLMVISIAGSWWTGESGHLEWHRWSGYTLLGLLIFRIYWGFFGSSTARFGQFVRGPRAIATYLRGEWPQAVGHNPLGALSVVAILAVLLLQIVLGLFAVDVDGIESGPLSLYVSFEVGRTAAEWHERVFNLLLIFIVLHILAIVWYRVKGTALVAAMFRGTNRLAAGTSPMQPASGLRLVIGLAIAIALTWAVTRAFDF